MLTFDFNRNKKMKQVIFVFTITVLSFLLNSCFLRDQCEGLYKEQLLRFGEFQIKIDSRNDTLSIGDSIRFSINLPRFFYDSISGTEVEIENIEIGFYVTRDTEEPKETSIIYIFDQYFDIIVNRGKMIDPYRFTLDKNNSGFGLDFYYVCKKELTYFIPIRFKTIVASGVDTKCMLGDIETWNSGIFIDSEYNTFENQQEFPNYFGFIVK